MDDRVRGKGQGKRGKGKGWAAGLPILLLCTVSVWAHPFDGDGDGLPKEGSSNVQAYLYLEPFTCRIECLVWLPSALEAFGLPQGSELVLSPEVKAQLLAKVRAEAAQWCALKANGTELPLELITATVLRGMPGRSDALKPDEAVGVMDAMLGLTWECSAPGDLKDVELRWNTFPQGLPDVPVTLVYGPIFERGMVLDPKAPSGTWKNDGKLPPAKPLAPVPPVAEDKGRTLPLGSLAWMLVIGIVLWRKGRLTLSNPTQLAASAVVLLAGAAALFAVPVLQFRIPGQPKMLELSEAQNVLQALLRNTYRAFEQRDESAVYDTLNRSISGDLLQRIYLQTAQSLALDAQDGTRVKVSDLAVELDGVSPIEGREGFIAHGQWTAFGRVGHWGHMHQRINKYKADLTVEPVQGEWKLTGLVVHEEVRDFVKQP